MRIRLPIVILLLACVLEATGRAVADDPPKPDLKALHQEVQKLVEKHYPKAKVSLKDQAIHFEFNTRKFQIHNQLPTGEWQDAHEEDGPQKGGIHGVIEVCAGKYMGMAATPQTFDRRYFTLLLTAAYSKRLDHHLYVHVKYPRHVPKEFLKEFEGLVDGFEKHVPVVDK